MPSQDDLYVPKVCGQVIAPLPTLERDDLSHIRCSPLNSGKSF